MSCCYILNYINIKSNFVGGKSSVLLDVKPWDDETDMKKLEEAVRSIEMEGLFWGACMVSFTNILFCLSKLIHYTPCFLIHWNLYWIDTAKLVPVGYGIKKLQIMLNIVDDLVSVDTLIEERLTVEPCDEWIQSCDIVAFNKI